MQASAYAHARATGGETAHSKPYNVREGDLEVEAQGREKGEKREEERWKREEGKGREIESGKWRKGREREGEKGRERPPAQSYVDVPSMDEIEKLIIQKKKQVPKRSRAYGHLSYQDPTIQDPLSLHCENAALRN